MASIKLWALENWSELIMLRVSAVAARAVRIPAIRTAIEKALLVDPKSVNATQEATHRTVDLAK
jgi:hypothetical protein